MKRINFLLTVFLIAGTTTFTSCESETKIEKNLWSKGDVTTVKKENSVMFIDTVEINNIKYIRQAVSDYNLNHNIVRLTVKNDTIEYEKDGLFINDSIYDINNDGMNDFIVKSQSTNGFVKFAYLFDKEHNLLTSKPDTLFNFTPIDKKSFFQISPNFFTFIYDKYTWSDTTIIWDKTYLVEYTNQTLVYFEIVDEDTNIVKDSEIPDEEIMILQKEIHT